MTSERAVQRILASCSDAQIAELALRLDDNRGIEPPAGAPVDAREAVLALRAAMHASPALTGAGVALALRCALRERRQARDRASRPVWTGPGAAGEQRLTASELVSLIDAASERVLVVSYAAYTLAEVAAALSAAVQRGCAVDAVFETEADSGGAYTGPAAPFASVPGLQRWRWPADERTEGAVLHAKLLVADGKRALIGSANLTHRALHHNLEAGVLIGDPAVAAALDAHIRRLMADGVLQRCA
jgi:phosphatidylserine/phosphatidylglycerophosphate/cardiolipin synthase-like enzyme